MCSRKTNIFSSFFNVLISTSFHNFDTTSNMVICCLGMVFGFSYKFDALFSIVLFKFNNMSLKDLGFFTKVNWILHCGHWPWFEFIRRKFANEIISTKQTSHFSYDNSLVASWNWNRLHSRIEEAKS